MSSVVIGNAYGDEGKGLVTDWLAEPGTTVVRFSGGAQAGHTVVTPEGVRHVFHHFGSGTLRSAPTFLSRYFFCDPVMFNRERAELVPKLETLGAAKLGVVTVDPLAPVVTPYDVLLNQLTERRRGTGAHGSCGCGIGEAARRHEERPERLVYADLDSPLLGAKLDAIERYVVTEIWRRDGAELIEDAARADLDRCRTLFLQALPAFLEGTYAGNLPRGPLVFEGSQGLLLDRDIGAMPHVTRAKTGLVNVERLLGTLAECTVYFVARTYLTRHGAGPLSGEDAALALPDATNVDNPWQGSLRFAPYDVQLLAWARRRALAEVGPVGNGFRRVLTCADQVPACEPADIVAYGPTRADVRWSRT